MATGGDDLVIQSWDFHQENILHPSRSHVGPHGNIFTLAFSSSNQHIFAGGVDEIVYKYDFSAFDRSPSATYRYHDGTIRAISAHPFNDQIVLTCSEDGRVVSLDARAPSSQARNTLQLTTEVSDAQFHPSNEHLFLTGDHAGNLCLRDNRMAFGPLKERSNQGVVRKFCTKFCTRTLYAKPEISSIAWNVDGTTFAATMLYNSPTIYALSDPFPIATCSSETYSNCCTIKHGSFGNFGYGGDEFYAAGSDDFKTYVWKIPHMTELLAQRETISWPLFSSRSSNTSAFAQSEYSDRIVPATLNTPYCCVGGHRSIVNSAALHPSQLHLVTAGIESSVILHSPTPYSPCTIDLERTSTSARQLPGARDTDEGDYARALLGPPLTTGDAAEEERTIQMFDHIIRSEGNTNLFRERGTAWNDESEEEIEELEDGMDVGDETPDDTADSEAGEDESMADSDASLEEAWKKSQNHERQ